MNQVDIKEIKEAYLYLKNQKYSGLRSQQKTEENIYFQDFNPFPNEDEKNPYITHKVRPPRGRRIVDGPADWLAMDKVVCHRPPKAKASGKEDLESQRLSDKTERWAQGLLDYIAMVQPYYLRMLAQQLPLRGECWLKIVTDWEYIIDPDQYQGIPFSWVVPDSMMTYSVLNMDAYSRPNIVFEEKVHTLQHIKDLLAKWNLKSPKIVDKTLRSFRNVNIYQDVTLVEWCTEKERGFFAGLGGLTEATWFAVPLDGEDRQPNPDGVVPYIRGFNSLGIWPYDGELSKLVIGFLRPMRDVIIQDSRDRSKIDTITNYWAAPITSWITDGSVVLGDADMTIAPGHVYEQIKDRKELKIEPAPPIPTSLIQQIQLNEALMEEYDPMLLRGRGTPGETAVGQNQRIGLGLQKWEPLKITLKQIIGNALSTTFQIVEKMGVVIKIDDNKIKSEDISGYYKIVVDIKPGNPEEQTRRMLLAKDLEELYSDEDLAEKFLGEENATESVRKKRISKMIKIMLQTPDSPLWNMVYQEAMKELGLEQLQTELARPGKPTEGQVTSPGAGQNIVGGHPTRGVAGIAQEPPISQPPSQEQLNQAQEALTNMGGG